MPVSLLRRTLFGGSILLTSSALAGPTGLALMPIADILRHREMFAELSASGTERNVSKAHDYGGSLTLGLFDRVEVGYEADFRGEYVGNVKLQLFEDVKRLPRVACSVGATNWRGGSMDAYVVGRYDGQGYRLHGGCWHTQGSDHLMVGADFPAGPLLACSVEYLSGRDGAAWGSLTYAVPQLPGLEVGLGLGVPSRHAEGLQHAVTLAYAFKI